MVSLIFFNTFWVLDEKKIYRKRNKSHIKCRDKISYKIEKDVKKTTTPKPRNKYLQTGLLITFQLLVIKSMGRSFS